MVHRKTSKRSKAKTMLRLADLEQSKNAVLHSLGAASSQESYGHALTNLSGGTVPNHVWHLTERLSFGTGLLEQKNLAPSTINVRLAAVRRLAYEASDTAFLALTWPPESVVSKREAYRRADWQLVNRRSVQNPARRTAVSQPPRQT